MRLRSLLAALGINAVPAAGWFLGEWSAGTTLVLYWMETLLGTLLVGARILFHRRMRPSKGHWDYRASENQALADKSGSTYLSAFLVPALGFTLTHGIFLAVLLGMMMEKNLTPEARINTDHLLLGLGGVALFQLGEFAFDLVLLKDRPFAWLERLGQQALRRVFVIHFTIIVGMALVVFTGANRNFFGVFIFLKTLLNCSSALPQWQPKSPPGWIAKLMDRMKDPKNKDISFAQYWKQTDDREAVRLARNEEPIDGSCA
jgi:Family of unknown function (DUF6498)